MYYSSESSDSENIHDEKCVDFSYCQLNSENISEHLINVIIRRVNKNSNKLNNFDKKNKQIKKTNFMQQIHLKDKSNVALKKNIKKKETSNAERLHKIEYTIYDDVTENLYLQHNLLISLPFEISLFCNLKHLDLSNNNLTILSEHLNCLMHLQILYLRNNELVDNSFPKELNSLTKLRELNLSGNKLSKIPNQIYELSNLKYLYIGNNNISEILPTIKNLQNLQVLQLGGNELEYVPDEVGLLSNLSFLALCDNKIRKLPRAISQLARLRSLLLHKNNLCCLPVEIVKLRGLNEISLRDNPLVNKFVDCCAKEIIYTPPSLLELAARVIKLENISYKEGDIPFVLADYINSGQKCVNPKCKGLYFTSCVAHIKFVDFCGMYRVPLLHYLCSSRCTSKTPAYYNYGSEEDSEEENSKVDTLKKVLLGSI